MQVYVTQKDGQNIVCVGFPVCILFVIKIQSQAPSLQRNFWVIGQEESSCARNYCRNVTNPKNIVSVCFAFVPKVKKKKLSSALLSMV